MKYPHSESLKKNRDFQLLYKEGKSRANRYLVLYVKENGMEKNRFGVSVSKKAVSYTHLDVYKRQVK